MRLLHLDRSVLERLGEPAVGLLGATRQPGAQLPLLAAGEGGHLLGVVGALHERQRLEHRVAGGASPRAPASGSARRALPTASAPAARSRARRSRRARSPPRARPGSRRAPRPGSRWPGGTRGRPRSPAPRPGRCATRSPPARSRALRLGAGGFSCLVDCRHRARAGRHQHQRPDDRVGNQMSRARKASSRLSVRNATPMAISTEPRSVGTRRFVSVRWPAGMATQASR